MNKIDIYDKAIITFSPLKQVLKAVEELSELQKELIKWALDDNNKNENYIAEEMADVYIILEQLEIIFNNKKDIEVFKDYKLNKLKERLNKL